MDDYIKREDAIKAVKSSIADGWGRISPVDACQNIRCLPSADRLQEWHEEHKRGEWIPLKGMQPPELHGKHYCSNCDYILHLSLNGGVYNYCPNCGADMR